MTHHRTKLTLLVAILLLMLSACSSATPTEPPTNTPEPTPTLEPTPTFIPATDDVIQIGAFEFHIVRVATDHTLVGFTPNGMGSDRILYIEFDVLSGDENNFALMSPTVMLESGDMRRPVASIVGRSFNALTDMTLTGEDGTYRRTEDTTVLAYMIPSDHGQVTLEFDSGETIDLTPLFE
ncbi:MAG: hypothetical protein PVF49_07130 [Anaerolineales bacterium]|jgi:hypothetical protein